MTALVSEGNPRQLQCDDSTHALKFTDYEHAEAHDGKMFSAMISTADMGALTTPNDTLHLNWTVGAGPNMHLLWIAACGGAGRMLGTVNPTGGLATPEGSIVPFNHRVGSSNVSATSLIYYNATAPTGGSVGRDEYFGVTNVAGKTVESGGSRGAHERILTPGTVISLQLICTANVFGTLEIIWYEHTDKETIS